MTNCGSCKYVRRQGNHFLCMGQKNAPKVDPQDSTCEWYREAAPVDGIWFDPKQNEPTAWESVLLSIPVLKPYPTVREGYLARYAGYCGLEDKYAWRVPVLFEEFKLEEIDGWAFMPKGRGE